jgi:glutamine amidotransferase
MIAILDYGAGNLNSVKKAFDHLGAAVVVTGEVDAVAAADKIVFPGVGHFSTLRSVGQIGMRDALLQAVSTGKPLLGICLGMQWLFEGSEECAEIAGANLFPGKCQRFPASVKSPHVGWNSLTINGSPRLLHGIAQNSFAYYTHSFCAPLMDAAAACSEYGLRFTAAVERDNVFGVQFHPEKSGEVGLAILKNFCEV